MAKRGFTSILGTTSKCWLTLYRWLTFTLCAFSSFYLFLAGKDGKVLKKLIWTRGRLAKHLFTGQNTQQKSKHVLQHFKLLLKKFRSLSYATCFQIIYFI